MRTGKEIIDRYFPWNKDMPLDDKFDLESIISIIQKEGYNQAIDDVVTLLKQQSFLLSTQSILKLKK